MRVAYLVLLNGLLRPLMHRQWAPDSEHCFYGVYRRACELIEEHGRIERFYSRRQPYLYVGERKYWLSDPPKGRPTELPVCINRTWLDVSRYRENARELGYDGEELEALVERWSAMLARARGES